MAMTGVVEKGVVEIQEPSSNVSFDEAAEMPAQTPADLLQEDFDALVNEVAAMRERLSGHFTFKEWFATRVDTILQLRSRFPERGSHDKVVVHVVGHNPEEVTWEEFVRKYLGITPQYLNRLIHEAIQGASGPTEKKPNAKDLLITRLREEVSDLKSQIAEREESPADGEISAVAGDSPRSGEPIETADVDEGAPEDQAWDVVIAYFREYRTAPAAFADELRSLIREFGLTRKISVEEI